MTTKPLFRPWCDSKQFPSVHSQSLHQLPSISSYAPQQQQILLPFLTSNSFQNLPICFPQLFPGGFGFHDPHRVPMTVSSENGNRQYIQLPNLFFESSHNEKMRVCNVPGCGKQFKTSYNLKRHIKRHSGHKPYICPWFLCNKRFVESDDLKRHSKIHMEERMFPCQQCEKRFRRSDHLNSHMKKVHRLTEVLS